MPISNTIKDYLVSLGYEVDSSAYSKFVLTLRQTQGIVEKHTSILSSTFAKAGLSYAGMVGTVVATTALMVNSLAKADLEYEKTALSLHMAKDAAKQYSIALKVLGEPPEMLAWMPELHEHYVQLRKDAMLMELPEEYSKRMGMIRGIGQEFNRLKQESIYGLQWIGFSIVKNLQSPLERSRFSFEKFNDKLIESMPKWTEQIGRVLVHFLKIFGNVGNMLRTIWENLTKIWDSFSPTAKALVGIALLIWLFTSMGPFGKMMIIITALIALMSELWDAMQGKETVIPKEILQTFAVLIDGVIRVAMVAIETVKLLWNVLSLGPTAIKGLSAGIDVGLTKIQLVTRYGRTKPGTPEWEEKKRLEQFVETRKEDYKKFRQTVYGTTKDIGTNFSEYNKILNPSAEGAYKPWYESGPTPYGMGMSSEEVAAKSAQMAKAAAQALPTELPKNIEQYRKLAEGVFGANAQFMLRIAQAENAVFDPMKISPIRTGKWKGTSDVGLLQINTMHLPDLQRAGIASSITDLQNPETNFRAGQWLLQKQGISAWNPSRERWGKYISEYRSGATGSMVNSNNSIKIDINMPIQNAEGDLASKTDKIFQNVRASVERQLGGLFMPNYTTNDSSGFAPGEPVKSAFNTPTASTIGG